MCSTAVSGEDRAALLPPRAFLGEMGGGIWAETQLVATARSPALLGGWLGGGTWCLHTSAGCKVISQLQGPQLGLGKEQVCVNTAHLQD